MSYFEFYNEGEKEFYNKHEGEAVCIYGEECTGNSPIVSVVIPTFKRPKLLKQAIDSVLAQRDFVDFEIIVMDNDADHINENTDTFLLMKSYDSNKIRYYRNKVILTHNQDYGVSLARGKWIVFLHDDDILHPYHLKIMTEIAKKNLQAKYISCPIKDFVDGTSVINTKFTDKYQYSVYTKAKEEACLGYYTGWLGALIDRKAYISSGGMPTYCNNLGDFCMVQKIHYKFGIWELYGEAPLYFHRVWKGQASSLGTETWINLYVAEYEYFQYVSKVYHPLTYKYWDRISAYRILDKARHMNRGLYKYNINLQSLAEKAGMSFNSLYRNKQYKLDIAYRIVYEIFSDFLFTRERDRGVVKL